MIYTVTCNPALDYVVRVNSFAEGETNRSLGESLILGGKGINVSLVLRELGLPSVALGFVAGITGTAIETGLDAAGVQHNFVQLPKGNSRVNLKMKRALAGKWVPVEGGEDPQAPDEIKETELNGRGPYVDADAAEVLCAQIAQLQAGDMLVLSGSKAAGMDDTVYYELASAAPDGVRVVVDATGDLLLNALPARPFMIKPNNEELAALADCSADDRDALVEAAQQLVARGAQYVLVSCGGEGAFLVDADGLVAQVPAAKGTLVNSVGAGDSMVAGFIAGVEGVQLEGDCSVDGLSMGSEAASPASDSPAGTEGEGVASASAESSLASSPFDPAYALRLGAAAGSATAFSVGLATRQQIAALLA